MRKLLMSLAVAASLFPLSAYAVDLSAGATDLTSVGLPGYWGLRVDCDHSQYTALKLATNPRYEPLVVPVSGDVSDPRAGNSSFSPPSDPSRDYVIVIWADSDAAPPLDDGQPSWPSSCAKSSAAASAALLGIIDGVPIDGY